MQVNQVRKEFLDFFANDNHKVLPSSPLIPHNDPSLMFTNSGMVQFKNYFTGVDKPKFTKVATSQKCVRAGGKHNDLENVGYTARHHTFFEMLGNFSFGDYFKKHAIEMAWRFLTENLGISKSRLYITVYHNDDEAYQIWHKLTGFTSDKLIRISTDDNFWAMGEYGPCGPCSEIFFDHGDKYYGGLPGTAEADGDRYVEIWNLVFMQYEKLIGGERVSLPKPSIDTGMGIERVAAVLQGVNNNFDIDVFQSIIKASKDFTGNEKEITSHRVIADHLRSTCFLIADGVNPSNEGRGYVLRRIMRRAMRHVYNLGYKDALMYRLVPILVNEMGEAYPELKRAEASIISLLKSEEERFRETLVKGMHLLNLSTQQLTKGEELDGETAFKLYDTYGFPFDLTKDILRTRGINVDEEKFEKAMEEQQKKAKAAWIGSGEQAEEKIWFSVFEQFGSTEFIGYSFYELQANVLAIIKKGELVKSIDAGESAIIILDKTPFYAELGGQVGDIGKLGEHEVIDTKLYPGKLFGHHIKAKKSLTIGENLLASVDIGRRKKINANHSATHLLHKVLRDYLGEHVVQKGSLVSDEKLRFDFSYNNPLSNDDLVIIEDKVNAIIISNDLVLSNNLEYKDAVNSGALALFGEKYDDEVRVVEMSSSKELCGGTHVKNTGDIGMFKIIKEESIAAGIRRIEALTGLSALHHCQSKDFLLKKILTTLKCSDSDLLEKLQVLIDDKKHLQKKLLDSKVEVILSQLKEFKINDNLRLIFADATASDLDSAVNLRQLLDNILSKKNSLLNNSIIVLGVRNAMNEDKKKQTFSLIIKVDKNIDFATKNITAQHIVMSLIDKFSGKGGGNNEVAQVGGMNCVRPEELCDYIIGKLKNSC